TPLFTALAGLAHPDLCGGFAAVVEFIKRHHAGWTDEALLEAQRRVPGKVMARLGWILEREGRVVPKQLVPKRKARTKRPPQLEAKGARGGVVDVRWWLRVNVQATQMPTG